jgi:Flp pilus assembly protein TadD
VRALVVAAAVAALAALSGCATYQGARLYDRGTRALERGDAAAAVADLERASALVPDASEIQNHLGLAYEAQGRPADARAAFERAVALDCDNDAAQHNLHAAEARARAGEVRESAAP